MISTMNQFVNCEAISPCPHDVICGRGGLSNNHVGNNEFRKAVLKNKSLYSSCPKYHKSSVARAIVLAIQNRNPPGRFIERNNQGTWYVISVDKAMEKTSQALRERIKDDSNIPKTSQEIDEEKSKIEAMLKSVGVQMKRSPKKRKYKNTCSEESDSSTNGNDIAAKSEGEDKHKSNVSKDKEEINDLVKNDGKYEVCNKDKKRKLEELVSPGTSKKKSLKPRGKPTQVYDLKSVAKRFPLPNLKANAKLPSLSKIDKILPEEVASYVSSTSTSQPLYHPRSCAHAPVTNYYHQSEYKDELCHNSYHSRYSPWREVSCRSSMQKFRGEDLHHHHVYPSTPISGEPHIHDSSYQCQERRPGRKFQPDRSSFPIQENCASPPVTSSNFRVVTPTSGACQPTTIASQMSKIYEASSESNDLFVPDFKNIRTNSHMPAEETANCQMYNPEFCSKQPQHIAPLPHSVDRSNNSHENNDIDPIPFSSINDVCSSVEADIESFKDLFFPIVCQGKLKDENNRNTCVTPEAFYGNINIEKQQIAKRKLSVVHIIGDKSIECSTQRYNRPQLSTNPVDLARFVSATEDFETLIDKKGDIEKNCIVEPDFALYSSLNSSMSSDSNDTSCFLSCDDIQLLLKDDDDCMI